MRKLPLPFYWPDEREPSSDLLPRWASSLQNSTNFASLKSIRNAFIVLRFSSYLSKARNARQWGRPFMCYCVHIATPFSPINCNRSAQQRGSEDSSLDALNTSNPQAKLTRIRVSEICFPVAARLDMNMIEEASKFAFTWVYLQKCATHDRIHSEYYSVFGLQSIMHDTVHNLGSPKIQIAPIIRTSQAAWQT